MNDFQVRLAENQEEIKASQRLRFEVFNLEMREGLSSSFERGLDIDIYDAFCDHIIVIDPQKDSIIGTYRLLLGSKVEKDIGFYSEKEFDLRNIKKLKGAKLELGRSCIRKEYRNQKVLSLLWQGIAGYIMMHNIRHVFGCASLHTVNPKETSIIFNFLKEKFYSAERFRVYPLDKCKINESFKSKPEHAKEIFRKLPALIQSYIKIGAKVCGYPTIDKEFKTTDLFMLLDLDKLPKSYQRRFLKNNRLLV